MGQFNLFRRACDVGRENEWVMGYGGGLNTAAGIVLLARLWREDRLARKPRVIFMSDPGSEKPETIRYRDEVMNPYLRANGWPEVTVSSRAHEAQFRPQAEMRETLLEECMRKSMLPSAAYNHKSCSLKYKRDVFLWYMERQTWPQSIWERGEKIEKVIGYDFDEQRRVKSEFGDKRERARYFPSYPLVLEGMGREHCEEIVIAEGLPVPIKSSCFFCPNNTLEEWEWLRTEHPELWAQAVALSSAAYDGVEEKEMFGLALKAEKGKKHLHLWQGNDRPEKVCGVFGDNPDPCECAT